MVKCYLLKNVSNPRTYSGFALNSANIIGYNCLEFGHYLSGKLNKGIRYYKNENCVESGNFKNDVHISGMKRLPNGNIVLSRAFGGGFESIDGKCACIYINGSWMYAVLKNDSPEGPAIMYDALTNKIMYREYKNGDVKKEYTLNLASYGMNLKVQGDYSRVLDYNIDTANFRTKEYSNGAEAFSMGYNNSKGDFVLNGLGYIYWNEKEQYVGQWKDNNRTGLGAYYYTDQVTYGVYNQNKKQPNSLSVFNSGEVSFGLENSGFPRFTLFPSGDFYVRNGGDYVLYVKNDFTVTIEKYNGRKWIQNVKTIISGGVVKDSSIAKVSTMYNESGVKIILDSNAVNEENLSNKINFTKKYKTYETYSDFIEDVTK